MLKIRSLGSNQTELTIGETLMLFSYQTPVVAYVPGRGWLRTREHYSRTTSKHINKWIGSTYTIVSQSEINSILVTA